jgi:beta-lactamase class A
MLRLKAGAVKRFMNNHRRRLLLWGGGGILALTLLVQLFYPPSLLTPFREIDGQSVGMRDKEEVINSLDNDYKKLTIPLYFGSSVEPYRTPSTNVIGLTVNNESRINSLDYPLWLRLIPSSLLWAHAIKSSPAPTYDHDDQKLTAYMTRELGESCDVAPKNASLTVRNDSLQVTSSEKGGTCRLDDVRNRLKNASPRLGSDTRITIPVKERSPSVSNDEAKKLQALITKRIENGLAIKADSETVTIDRKTLLGWLQFDTSTNETIASLRDDKSAAFFADQLAPKVARAAGVSKVATQDFTEISRVDGVPGRAIDDAATRTAIAEYIVKGGDEPAVATKPVAPRVEYTRSYSPNDVGLSALLKQYAESHPGSYGISLIELSGQRRRAVYQESMQFRTASTYKLYVAYGTLKRVESGAWKWSDQIQGGRNLEKCFDDMIVKSDNPCGETLLAKIGYTALTNELKAASLTGTSFTGKEPVTTAGDLSTFNASLEAGQLVSSQSRQRLLDAMKRNIYRQGIPAGAGVPVADKVGFLDGYLHDAAVIYTQNGPVVLSVMTNGSSWGAIADLTRQIQSLLAR